MFLSCIKLDVFLRKLYAFVCIPNYYVMVRCNDIHLAKAFQYAALSLVGPSSSSRIESHIGCDTLAKHVPNNDSMSTTGLMLKAF